MRLFWMTVVLLFFAEPQLFATDPDPLAFASGVRAYESGIYKDAIAQWQKLIPQGDSAAVRFNLGDAYYRDKQLGRALFEFRKAEVLRPRDPDVRYNIEYLRKRTIDRIAHGGWRRSLEEGLAFSVKESEIAVAILSLFFWGVVLVAIWRRDPWARLGARALGGLWLLALGLAVAKAWAGCPFGVVTVSEAEVRSGFDVGSVVLFKLHEGTEFSVGDAAQSEWVQIEVSDGKRGWMRRADVVM